MRRTLGQLVIAAFGAALLASAPGCEPGGCMSPTEFPASERIPNAVQVRIARPGFDRIGREVIGLITGAFGSTRLGFEPQCEGDVEVCCNLPPDACGLMLDLVERPGDGPRLSFTELADGRDGLAVTFRSRVRTDPGPLEMEIDGFFVNGECTVDINTEAAGDGELTISAVLAFDVDPMTQATRISLSDVGMTGLDEGDIDIRGTGNACSGARNRLDEIIADIEQALAEQAPKLVEVPLCKPCGVDSECGGGATCSVDGVCEAPGTGGEGPRCLQQLGFVGRLPSGDLLGGLLAETPLDLYMVSAGAAAPNGGLSLFAGSGLFAPQPGSPTCAPAAPAPELPAGGVPISDALSKNQLDGLGEFDFGVALHRSFLDRAGWALHQAGVFCTTIDTSTIDKLNSDSLMLMFPSLLDLVDGESSPVAVRLRPQKPPTFRLGTPAGAVVAVFNDFDVDFFMTFRERNVRLFTARADVAIPIDLGVDMDGAITPLVGDLSDAFTNIRVTSPGLLAEPPDDLAGKFETIGAISVSLLIGSIGEFELPGLPFLRPRLIEEGLKGIDDGDFLGLFGQLEIGASTSPFAPDPKASRSVETRAAVLRVELPAPSAYSASRLDRRSRPSVVLQLGGAGAREEPLEWQFRIDGGAWSPFQRESELRVSRNDFWVATEHTISVRARHWNRPESTDPSPIKLVVNLRPAQANEAGAQRRAGARRVLASVSDEAGTSTENGAVWLVLALIALGALGAFIRRRRCDAAAALLAVALGAAPLSGCVVGVDTGREIGPAYGRWSDIASDGNRAVASSYESREGDLVLGTVVASGVKQFEIVDDAGDVGAWTSIELVDGLARIAYQDRSLGALKFAVEDASGFATHFVDEGGSSTVCGRYASLASRPGGGFGIAYLAEKLGEDGGAITQLRFAETEVGAPASASDWSFTPLARAEAAETPALDAVPLGTGLYASAGYLSSGDPVIAYCDTTAAALAIDRRSNGEWTTTVLDADAETGPCAFSTIAIASDDTIHIAYQALIAGDLRHVSMSPGGQVSDVTVVDTGARDLEQHPVGGSATLILEASGEPLIIYQDGFTLELRVARKLGGAWAHEVAASGPAALGFSVGAAWYGDTLILSSGAINRGKAQAHQITAALLD